MSAAWVGTACGRPLTLEPGEEPCCGVGATRRPAYAAGAAWLDGGWCLPGRPQHPGALAAYVRSGLHHQERRPWNALPSSAWHSRLRR